MDFDDFLEYLIVTDQYDEFMGIKKEENDDEKDDENTNGHHHR